jgi:sporulation protein YlmC with PRC-barrel domain
MQLKEGAKVFTSDGQEVGEIDRVVINPASKEVTHVVIRMGFLITTDKVVPISLIGPVDDGHVTLRGDKAELEALPDFEERHYVLVGSEEAQRDEGSVEASALYWYPPVGSTWWGTGGAPGYYGYAVPPYYIKTEEHIPEGEVALKEGARVLSADGKHVGHVEAVLTDVETDRATHLLISKGLFLKETKLVPTTWISTVLEDEVHLVVGSELLAGLPAYEPAE